MKCRLAIFLAVLSAATLSRAQNHAENPFTPEEERKFYEYVESEVSRFTQTYKLEDWQEFKVDSIFTNNWMSLQASLKAMQKAGVENEDLYVQQQDKWADKTYEALRKVLNPQQWEKYRKVADRENKTRGKRAKKNK